MNKYIIFFAIFIIQYSLFTPLVSADWLIDRSGTLVKLDPLVLGDNDEQKSEIKNEEKKDERKQEEVKSEQSKNRSDENKPSEVEKKSQEKSRERAKEKLESTIKINEIKANKNKTETESEIEIEDSKFKIKQKIKDQNGRETETELEMEQDEEVEVESLDGDEVKKFRLKTRDDDSVEVERNNIRVHTRLPISINSDNELVVTRPDGTQKVVAVMPDQALAKLREQNILISDDSVDTPELEEEDGQSVYKIDGEKQEKVLGIFKISYRTKAVVSAETGEIVRTELSNLDRFLSIFSF